MCVYVETFCHVYDGVVTIILVNINERLLISLNGILKILLKISIGC